MAKQNEKPDNARAKQWVFTFDNYTEAQENRLKELECEWMIFGHEIAPTTGTPHLQGAIIFKGRRYRSRLTKLFRGIHLEIMRGSPQDSKTYCTKEDPEHYFEKGIIPLTGGEKTKKKWEEAYQAAIEGRFDDIPRDMYLCHDRAFHRVYEEHQKDPLMDDLGDKELKDHFLWLWGPTGTGKSHTAREISKKLNCEEPFYKQINKWWNGYSRQKVTIIEEADPKRCEHLAGYFKQWCDKWPFSGEVKCGNFPSMRPQYIIVTSNYSIQECFPEEQDYIPLKRRFTEHELTRRGEPFSWPQFTSVTDDETGQALALPGNTNPGGQNPLSPGIEPPPSQPPFESEEIEDFEEEEERVKRRRCIEDAE